MSFTYILISLKDRRLYIGSTRLDVKKRLCYHNRGSVRSTKSRRPFELVYYERYPTYQEARKREFFFKTGIGRTEVNKLLEKKRAGT